MPKPGRREGYILQENLLYPWGRMHGSRKRLFLHWIPALAAVAMIGAESTVVFGAANTSRWLLPLWVRIFGPISPGHWAFVHHILRKSGHFVGYGLVSLAFLDGWRVALERRWPEWRARMRHAAGLAIASTLLLASWDEWHQSFLPGRTSSPWDVLLDGCGAVAAQLVLFGVLSVWPRRPLAEPAPSA